MEVYNKPQYDDFTGFTFNGKHSSEFGLLRISDGDRYEDTLVPSLKNETSAIPGGPGQYYWGEEIEAREFKIPIAYDNIGEIEKRKIKLWLHPDDELHELIFDERPYVKYWVKCDKEVIASELCFNEHYIKGKDKYDNPIDGVRRVYKGEMEISFIAPMPYGVVVSKNLDEFDPNNKTAITPRENFEEWKDSSGLLSKIESYNIDNFKKISSKEQMVIWEGNVYNGGDIDNGFELRINICPRAYRLKLENVSGNYYTYNILDKNGIKGLYNSNESEFAYEANSPFNIIKRHKLTISSYDYANQKIKILFKTGEDKVFLPDRKDVDLLYIPFMDDESLVNIELYNKDDKILKNLILKIPTINSYVTSGVLDNNNNSENWPLSIRAAIYGGLIKIDTNKKIVAYQPSFISKNDNNNTNEIWYGITDIYESGDFFKLPSNILDNLNKEEQFSKIRITGIKMYPTVSQDGSETSQNNYPACEISYNYLYI